MLEEEEKITTLLLPLEEKWIDRKKKEFSMLKGIFFLSSLLLLHELTLFSHISFPPPPPLCQIKRLRTINNVKEHSGKWASRAERENASFFLSSTHNGLFFSLSPPSSHHHQIFSIHRTGEERGRAAVAAGQLLEGALMLHAFCQIWCKKRRKNYSKVAVNSQLLL